MKMKKMGAAVILLAALSACGGGNSSYSLSGTVNGLTATGLQITNGYESLTIPANATSFAFNGQLLETQAFSVLITTQPTNQLCTVAAGSGYMPKGGYSGVQINCQNTYTIGGTITGLTGSGLVLANGADSVTVAAPATSFTLNNRTVATAVYSVGVIQQPTNPAQTCTVNNGTGVVGNGNVTSINVACQ